MSAYLRIHVICEGQTEEMFVNEVLAPHFDRLKISLHPSLIGKPGHKGGNVKFERLFTDIRNRLLSDKTAYCTTFFDFYGLHEDFPGKRNAADLAETSSKAQLVAAEMHSALTHKLGVEVMRRFIPYIQMYEFEALLFSSPQNLAAGIGQIALAPALQAIREQFLQAEDINNSPNTSPAKRIEKLFPAYKKPLHGALAALEIRLEIIRQQCPLFDAWLRQLEALKTS